MIAAKLANTSHGGDRKSDQAANLLEEDAAEMLNFDRVKIVYRSPSAPLKNRVLGVCMDSQRPNHRLNTLMSAFGY